MSIETAREKILKARRERHITQIQMSEILGVSRQSLGKLDNGQTSLLNPIFLEEVDYLGLDLSSLFADEKENADSSSENLIMSEGRWDVRGELQREQEARRKEREEYEKKLKTQEGIIQHLLELLDRKDTELAQKQQTIDYQNQKIGQNCTDGQ